MAELYYLMNGDQPLLSFEAGPTGDEFPTVEVFAPGRLPYGYANMRDFLAQRRAPKHRAHIERLLRLCQCDTLWGFLNVTHALGLNDTLWCRPAASSLAWADVSLYKGGFSDTIARIAFEGGLHGEGFSTTSPEFVTDGSYAKCWLDAPKRPGSGVADIRLLKTGSLGFSNGGLEPYSEVLAYQVARAFEVPAVLYELVMVKSRRTDRRMSATTCPLFTDEDTGFVPAWKLLDVAFPSVAELRALYESFGAGERFRRMVVFDALTVNPDRHTGNHGALMDNRTFELLGAAPVFDNNMALCPFAAAGDLPQLRTWATRELRPKIGEDFNLVAHDMLTPALRRSLMDMTDFCFDASGVPGFPEGRLGALEDLVRAQAKAILCGVPFNQARPAMSDDELPWQIEGWPSDPA